MLMLLNYLCYLCYCDVWLSERSLFWIELAACQGFPCVCVGVCVSVANSLVAVIVLH